MGKRDFQELGMVNFLSKGEMMMAYVNKIGEKMEFVA